MKRRMLATAIISVLATGGVSLAGECTSLQNGTVTDPAGYFIRAGSDEWGYNYAAQTFNGGYCDAFRGADWCREFAEDELKIQWNSAWLDRKDCDRDGELDRHHGYDTYRGSGAWVTNQMSGKIEVDGRMRTWTYFVKIVAAPKDAYLQDGIWYSADGRAIGSAIWEDFAVVETFYNDPSEGAGRIPSRLPVAPGFAQLR